MAYYFFHIFLLVSFCLVSKAQNVSKTVELSAAVKLTIDNATELDFCQKNNCSINFDLCVDNDTCTSFNFTLQDDNTSLKTDHLGSRIFDVYYQPEYPLLITISLYQNDTLVNQSIHDPRIEFFNNSEVNLMPTNFSINVNDSAGVEREFKGIYEITLRASCAPTYYPRFSDLDSCQGMPCHEMCVASHGNELQCDRCGKPCDTTDTNSTCVFNIPTTPATTFDPWSTTENLTTVLIPVFSSTQPVKKTDSGLGEKEKIAIICGTIVAVLLIIALIIALVFYSKKKGSFTQKRTVKKEESEMTDYAIISSNEPSYRK